MPNRKRAQQESINEARKHRSRVVKEPEPVPMAAAHEERPQGSEEVKRRLEADLQAEHERQENAAEGAAVAADGFQQAHERFVTQGYPVKLGGVVEVIMAAAGRA